MSNMSKGRQELPKITGSDSESVRNQMWQIETFMDYLLGTMITLMARYVDDSAEFEKIIHDEVKAKFKVIRDMRAKGMLS